jgi:shikimate kinase
MKLILIGMPGSGKTTLGRKIAHNLNLKFIDLDHEIEHVTQRSIENIFEKDGEAYFRELEKKTLHEVLKNENIVLSTGGGTPCFFDNINYINALGKSIFLDVSTKALQQRLLDSKANQRPMTKNKSAEEIFIFLEEKLQQRKPFYLQASIIVSGDNIHIDELLKEICPTN